jgi:hypothetical protein
LSERILGVIRVFTLDFRNLIKHLYFTTDRVIVVNIAKVDGKPSLSYLQKMEDKERELAGLSAEELLKNGQENFAIPMSEIVNVTLRKYRFLRARFITVETNYKKYRWQATGVPPEIKVAKFEQIEAILLPIFADKLIIKKG